MYSINEHMAREAGEIFVMDIALNRIEILGVVSRSFGGLILSIILFCRAFFSLNGHKTNPSIYHGGLSQ